MPPITLDGSSGITTSSSLTTGSGALYNGIAQGTSVASTSGTSITFTGIPSWAKRITVMFYGVSTSGTNNLLIQIGSGSLTTTGYVSGSVSNGVGGTGSATATTGFVSFNNAATNLFSGAYVLSLVTTNTWVLSGTLTLDAAQNVTAAGRVAALGGALDRVAITTVTGTDTFDAGSINILYE